MQKLTVKAVWDSEAGVWVATSEDLPGLVTESETREELIEKLNIMIPELLEEEAKEEFSGLPELPVTIMSEELTKIRLRA